MNNFKFLTKNNTYSGIELSGDIVDTIYEFCNNQIKNDRERTEEYLRINPPLIRNDGTYVVPGFPSLDQTKIFPEGKLKYYGMDFDNETKRLYHTLWLTLRQLTDDFQKKSYGIEVTQNENDDSLTISYIEVELDEI